MTGRSLVATFCAVVAVVASMALAGAAPSAPPAESPEAAATAILSQVVDELTAQSDHYWHKGDFETASRITRVSARLDPHFVQNVTTLAWLLNAGLNRPKEALAMYHRALRDNPDRYEPYHDLGMFYFERKEYALAVHYFRGSVERGAPMMLQHMLPHAYNKLGRPAEAIRAWREILERFPDDAVARRNLEGLEKRTR